MLAELPEVEDMQTLTSKYRLSREADVGLGVAIYPGEEKQDVQIVLITPSGQQMYSRPYGGPAGNAPRWALHHSLNTIRNL